MWSDLKTLSVCPSRETLEIQEYQELLVNQENLEIQEIQYVLANK